MAITVQARLDDKTEAALKKFERSTGLTSSHVVREGIQLFMDTHTKPRKPFKLIGQGEFDSGLTDLATNKKYMEDFGLTRAQREARLKLKKRA